MKNLIKCIKIFDFVIISRIRIHLNDDGDVDEAGCLCLLVRCLPGKIIQLRSIISFRKFTLKFFSSDGRGCSCFIVRDIWV